MQQCRPGQEQALIGFQWPFLRPCPVFVLAGACELPRCLDRRRAPPADADPVVQPSPDLPAGVAPAVCQRPAGRGRKGHGRDRFQGDRESDDHEVRYRVRSSQPARGERRILRCQHALVPLGSARSLSHHELRPGAAISARPSALRSCLRQPGPWPAPQAGQGSHPVIADRGSRGALPSRMRPRSFCFLLCPGAATRGPRERDRQAAQPCPVQLRPRRRDAGPAAGDLDPQRQRADRALHRRGHQHRFTVDPDRDPRFVGVDDDLARGELARALWPPGRST
jgi:hypothetical protein